MYCINHDANAKATCSNCGKALCNECIMNTDSGKITCSSQCQLTTLEFEEAIKLILKKSTGSVKSSAYGSYLMALIFIAFGFLTKIEFLKYFLIAAGIGYFVMGAFYHMSNRKILNNEKKS